MNSGFVGQPCQLEVAPTPTDLVIAHKGGTLLSQERFVEHGDWASAANVCIRKMIVADERLSLKHEQQMTTVLRHLEGRIPTPMTNVLREHLLDRSVDWSKQKISYGKLEREFSDRLNTGRFDDPVAVKIVEFRTYGMGTPEAGIMFLLAVTFFSGVGRRVFIDYPVTGKHRIGAIGMDGSFKQLPELTYTQ